MNQQENLFNTRGNGKFYQQPSNNNNLQKGNKKSRQDIKNFELTTKGFNPIQSKSVNKYQGTNNIHSGPQGKVSRLKEKYISLEKGQQNYNKRDHVTQTQAGFYKNKGIKIEFHDG